MQSGPGHESSTRPEWDRTALAVGGGQPRAGCRSARLRLDVVRIVRIVGPSELLLILQANVVVALIGQLALHVLANETLCAGTVLHIDVVALQNGVRKVQRLVLWLLPHPARRAEAALEVTEGLGVALHA